ncbi:MAG TPA: AsmA-like C-terminal region-containing protein [Bacteroidales bacterium]|nr:AsmA-like C-terminal region-containing protein [Bacteroidales bacterium]
MKKIVKTVVKVLLGLILFILVLLFTVPVIFKGKIKTKIESVINESVNAKVTFSDYKLTFFRNFPNLSFSLKDMYVAGVGKFEKDTLAGFRSFDLVFNLGSLFGSKGYEVKSIILDKAIINGIVLKDGSANWDISKPSAPASATRAPSPAPAPSSTSAGSPMKLLLKKVEARNSSVSYTDAESNIAASFKKMNFTLSGDMTGSLTDLNILFSSGEATVMYDNVKYLNKVVLDSKLALKANLDSLRFTFGDNYLSVNDMKLNFSGTVAMPKSDIITDLKFRTPETSFKTLLSLVPAVYMSGYENLKASGNFTLSGEARGIYSDADSTMPDVKLNMTVDNGVVSYPDLPEKISAIGVKANVFYDGKKADRSTVDVDRFHFELAGNPFDMTLKLRTPMSDPDFSGSMKGRIDLTALSKAVPVSDMKLSGLIEMAVTMSGRMSMIEKNRYEDFKAQGDLSIKNMKVDMKGYPGVEIREAVFKFTPAAAQMVKADLYVAGKSDFHLSGDLKNYIPYVFRNETIKGNLTLRSGTVDMASIMNAMPPDTSTATPADTTSLAVIAVPKNIDFDFNAAIEKFMYGTISAGNLKGHVIVKDGVLTIKDTGMDILGGNVNMNAVYDTRDTLKPVTSADLKMDNIGVKDAFKTFAVVRKFAPTAKGVDGKVSMQLTYKSLLGKNMMPVIPTIDGFGKLHSDQVTLLESATFDKFKQVLKLGDKYSNTFRDINVSFRISHGRVYISPFDIKTGGIKMNISGDQGLDQTINYLVKTEIPRSELGSGVNALMDNLASQAAKFGIAYKPSEIVKLNVRVKGTFKKPEVSPDFGGGSGTSSSATSTPLNKENVKASANNAIDSNREKIVKEAETRAQQIRDEAAKTAAGIRAQADSSAANLIKNAQTKGIIAKTAAQKGAEALKKEADKKANLLIQEADKKATQLVEDAKTKKL